MAAVRPVGELLESESDFRGGSALQRGPLPAHSQSPTTLADTQWPLKRYGRFLPPGAGPTTWEVFESDSEKGLLSLMIVPSGHFLISRGGTTLLEGFSLIEAHKWWKAVRRADCVLFGSKVKNESRMFRVQFSGDSREQALERCTNCVQKLLQYIDVQNPDGQNLNQTLQLSQPTNIGYSGSLEPVGDHQGGHGMEEGQTSAESTLPEGRLSIKQLAKSMLGSTSPKLSLAYQQSNLPTEELGPFLRLCLLDQSFPAFVEQVEQELKKLINE
ncbi:meiotic recombination protein REC114 isoform X1 [Stegostoma tigrinum]|uniref:meiotic recombination protein REC114 isoform X1 n=1 Tax=Stegostoma tigrinum TaxID=3053191 RepID=UPI0028706FC5|nr:meiotic recombination protein REC114 isoform X1 [Stegostoma tigrinum]